MMKWKQSTFEQAGKQLCQPLEVIYSAVQEPVDVPHQIKAGRLILLSSVFSRKRLELYQKLAYHLLARAKILKIAD